MKKLLFILVILPAVLSAQITFNPIYDLSNTPSATSDYHSVYSWMNSFYLAWGDNDDIIFRHSSDFGQNWTPNRIITTGDYPVIAAEGNNIVIFFHRLQSGVFHVKSTDGGVSWTSPVMISTHSSGITPQITYGGANNLYAVWEERPGTNYELFFSKSTDFGDTWSAPVNISNTSTTSRWVQIKSDYIFIYCAWIETSTYPFSDIYFIKSTDSGSTWSGAQNITNDYRPQNRICMDIAEGDATDIIYIACDDIPGNPPVFNYDDIYLIKSTNSGTTWSTAVNITNNSGHSGTPNIVIAEPAIYFTWSDNTNSAPAYDNSDVYFKMSPDGGNTWQDSLRLCSNPENSYSPKICWGIDGPIPSPWIDLSVIWYDYSTGDAEILARNGTHIYIPVQLVSFTAEEINSSVKLKWTTAGETNNKGFEIERKIFSGEWNKISFIEGSGTSTEKHEYSYTDKNLSQEKYFYRLKQVNFDGSFEYSKEIEADMIQPGTFVLYQNYPNPFNPSTTIRYRINSPGFTRLSLYSLLGEEISVLVNEEKLPGDYEAIFDGSSLPSGVYFCRLNSGQKTGIIKINLLK